MTRGRIGVQILCKDYEKCVANSSDAGNMARVFRECAKRLQRVCNNCLSMELTKEIPPMIEQGECKERLLFIMPRISISHPFPETDLLMNVTPRMSRH